MVEYRKIVYIGLMLLTLGLMGCDDLFPSADNIDDIFGDDEPEETVDPMQVTGVEFAPDYRNFSIKTKMLRDIGPYVLGDSSAVRIDVHETADGIPLKRASQSRVSRVLNLEADIIEQAGLRMLVLVDLTLPQEDVDRQRRFVAEAATAFARDNLFVAFLRGDSVSETLLASQYVINNDFVTVSSPSKQLYRAILQKKGELTSDLSHWYGAKNCVLVVLSDGKVYHDDNIPMAPNHYQLQQQLMMPRSEADRRFMAYFVETGAVKGKDHGAAGENDVLKVFCNYNRGACFHALNWIQLRNDMFSRLNIAGDDNEFMLTNPDYKIYRGSLYTVTLNFKATATDSVFASVPASFRLGSIYDPIIVGGHSVYYVVAAGLLLGLCILLGVWLLFQIVIPFIRYRLFLKKYVINYVGANMSMGNHTVAQRCYLCKGEFQVGDQVVVKCEHTMHKECWDANDYHCPEYSDRCKHGSHYYNHQNLLDSRNASFYMKWVLMSVVCALAAWVVFVTFVHRYSGRLLSSIIPFLHGVDPASPQALEVLQRHAIFVNQLPSFGLTMGFFLTLGFSWLTMRRRSMRRRLQQVVMRALLAAAASGLMFLFTSLLTGLLNVTNFTVFFDWIPWTIMGFIIAFCATFATRIRLRWLLIFVAVIIGFLSIYAWPPLFGATQVDFRVLLLVSYILFAIGLALCIASEAPRSDRYFLHISGAVKDMDVALYKWFRSDPHCRVTLGRSIDCSLQLSWDTEGMVDPQHAEIYLDGDVTKLRSLGGDVYVEGRLLNEDEICELYQGRRFSIGRTNFVYVEKDK